MGLLADILEAKSRELDGLHQLELPSPEEVPALPFSAATSPPGSDSPETAQRPPLRLIAEIKRRSPSAGRLSRALTVAERARAYEEAGASMISVLCDRTYFEGGYEHLLEARSACQLPLLCKEFVIDERQIEVARAFGASAVLLIVRCLPALRLKQLIAYADALGIVPVVEVCTAQECETALNAGALHVGVNARDLDTLQIDTERARSVLTSLPNAVVALQFSGLKSPEAVAQVAGGRADGALIGEVLMRQDDPRPLLSSFVQAARRRLSS